MPSGEAVPGKRRYLLLLLALPVEAPLAWMRVHADLRHHVVETVTLLLTTSIFYLLSVWLLLRKESRGETNIPIKWVLLAAFLFRATVFPLYPAFSDDLYRYRWEGKMQAFGFNPYTTAPDDSELAPLRDAVYPRISGKEFRGIYGPLLELEQVWFYRFIAALTPVPERQLFWFKAIAALSDLGIIWAVCVLLRARGSPVQRVLIYAWCPLPVFEFWATGHNDAVVLFLVMLALALAARKRDSLAALALSLAVTAKYWPALLFPSFTGYNWRRILPAAAILATTASVMSAPYWADITANAQFTTGFLGGWRNNDSLHGLIAAVARNPYAAKYATMALIATAALGVAAFRWNLEARTLALIVATLALSANVHPWYITWMVPLLPFYPIPGLLLWTALAPLAYQVLIDWFILGEWHGNNPFRWLVYVPVALVLLCWLFTTRAKRPHR
jgi:alpha-1,6-mannosyltransferase